MHIWSERRFASLLRGRVLLARTPARRQLRSIVFCQISMVDRDDSVEAWCEHALPLFLSDLLAVVCSRGGFGGPFLLEMCAIGILMRRHPTEVVEIVFVPSHAHFL